MIEKLWCTYVHHVCTDISTVFFMRFYVREDMEVQA